MGLCGSARCGCGITSDGSIALTGSGEPGDPFDLSFSSPWVSFTPTWTNLTVGSGVVHAYKRYVGDELQLWVDLTFGSGTSITGGVGMTLPDSAVSASALSAYLAVGQALFEDVGDATYFGYTRMAGGSTTTLSICALTASDPYVKHASVIASVPFTWGGVDKMSFNAKVPL